MPRPKKCRMVRCSPLVTFYKPQGVPLRRLEVAELSVEGLESLRLADAEGLDQETAAKKMGVSKATFCRILSQARKTVAQAIVTGMALSIQGGSYRLVEGPQKKSAGMCLHVGDVPEEPVSDEG